RHQDDDFIPAGHHAGAEFPARRLFHRFHRATAWRRAAGIDRRKNLIDSGGAFVRKTAFVQRTNSVGVKKTDCPSIVKEKAAFSEPAGADLPPGFLSVNVM